MSLFRRLLLWLQLILVIPHLITSSDVIQDTVTFSLGPDKFEYSISFFFFSAVTICKTYLVKTLWYFNTAAIISSALELVFSSIHSSLVVIRWFAQMYWSRHSSFCGMIFVDGHLEHDLPFTLLRPFLKQTTHSLSVHISSYPLFGFHKCPPSFDEGQCVPFFSHGGLQWHTFASYALPCQMAFVKLPLSSYLSHGN